MYVVAVWQFHFVVAVAMLEGCQWPFSQSIVTLIFASQLQWIFVFEFAFVFSGFVGGAAAFCLARFRLFDVDYIGKGGHDCTVCMFEIRI